jgi:hypothetical protein
VVGIDLERNEGLGSLYAWDLGDLVSDDACEILMVAHANHDDEVIVACDRVDLAYFRDIGYSLGCLGKSVDVAYSQDHCGDHCA